MISRNPAILIHLTDPDQYFITSFLSRSIELGVDFEFLNPKLLGGKWQSVISFQPDNDETKPNLTHITEVLSKIIHRFDNQFSWQQSQESGKLQQALSHYSPEELIEIAFKLNKSSKFTNKQLEYKGILQKGKLNILREIKALYTQFQIKQKVLQLQSNFFVLKPNSKNIFALISVSSNQLLLFESILQEMQINWQVHSWLQPIVTWDNSKSSLKVLLQEYYIPEVKSIIGLNLFGILWSVLVGYIFSDILAGVVIVIFALIINFLPKPKLVWLVARSQLLYSGLASVIFGLILGQINSQPIPNHGAWQILKNFQLVEFSNPTSILPLNQLLSQWLPNIAYLDFNFLLISFFAFFITFLAIFIKIWNQAKLGLWSLISVMCWFSIPIFLLVSMYWQLWLLVFAPVVLLFIFQPKPQLYNFIVGRNSIYTLVNLFFSLVSWFALFTLNVANTLIQHSFILISNWQLSLFYKIIFYCLFGLLAYQVVFRLLLNSFVCIWQNPRYRQIKSENKFRYWKF